MPSNHDESRRLLEQMIGGELVPSLPLVDELRRQHDECQWLDFKDGRLLNDRKERKAKLRWEVVGFGNAAGGILVFAVYDKKRRRDGDDKERPLSPCPALIGAEELHSWASKAVGELHSYFSPLPRYFQSFECPGGRILVV